MVFTTKKTLAAVLCFALLFAFSPPAALETAEPAAESILPEGTTAAASPTPTVYPSDLPLEEQPPATSEPTAVPDDLPVASVPPGSSFETALALEEGNTVQGRLTSEMPVQYYTVILSQGGSYTFTSGGSLSVKATLFDHDKSTIATFEPGTEGGGTADREYFAQTVSLKRGTDYFLVVESAVSGKTGQYTLNFSRESLPEPSAVPETTLVPEPTAEQAQAVTPAPAFPDPAQTFPVPESSAAITLSPVPPVDSTEFPPESPTPVEEQLPLPAGMLKSPGTAGWTIPPASKGIHPYPESAHPYDNNLTTEYPYEEPNAIGYVVTFHSNTNLEAGKDYLSLLDKDRDLLSFTDEENIVWQRFTGNQADNLTLVINSPLFYTRLATNASVTGYGFRYMSIVPIYPVSADTCVIYTCEQNSPSTVQLVWNSVTGASGYMLYFGTSGSFAAAKSVTGTSVIKYSLAPGQTYSFKVRPFTYNGLTRVYGSYSNEMSVQLLALPQIVKAAAVDATTAYLDWTDTENADGYYLFRSANPAGTFTYIKSVTESFATSSIPAAGTAWYYKVTPWRMYSIKVCGAQSAASTGIQYQPPVLTRVQQSSLNTARIDWTAQAGADGYSLYRSTAANGTYTGIKSVQSINTYNYSLTPGQIYYYKVRAYTDVNGSRLYGSYTGSLGVRILAAPVITNAAAAGTTATIKWNAVTDAAGYILFRGESASGPFQYIKTTTGLSVSNYNLIPGKTYYYSVSGYRLYGAKKVWGVKSAPAEVTPASDITYRALVIGQSDYIELLPLHGAADGANVSSMLSHLSMDGKTYETTLRTDLTASQILSAIPSALAGADGNDVSLFFYSGHGNNSTDSQAGSLYGIDSGLVTPAQLKNALDAVEGTIIVLIDSCGSGSYIYDGSLAKAAEAPAAKEDSYAFTSAIISAFSGSMNKTGELLTSKYKVLTASEHGEYSYETSLGGIFTNALCQAGGWDPFSHERINLLGDSNSDSIVTLQEGYTYIYNNTEYQVVQIYPGGSSYPLFSR